MYIITETTDDEHIGRYFKYCSNKKIIFIEELNGEIMKLPFDYVFIKEGNIRLVSSNYTIRGKIIN